jgi:hypothetical protein
MMYSLLNKKVVGACRQCLTNPSTLRCLVFSKDLSMKRFSSAIVKEDIEQHPSMIKQRFSQRLQEERKRSLLGGGKAKIDRQHAKGSLTARERLELLFDEGMLFLLVKETCLLENINRVGCFLFR